MVADTPEQPVELKTFCCRIVNDPVALAEEQKHYQELPIIRDRISNNPLLRHLLIE
jgi:hypothetical protein